MADRAGDDSSGRGATHEDAEVKIALQEYVILSGNRVLLRWSDRRVTRVYLSKAVARSLKDWGLIDPLFLDAHEGVALIDGVWKVTCTASRLGIKTGRRPIGDRAMTAAERQRASRERRKKEAKEK